MNHEFAKRPSKMEGRLESMENVYENAKIAIRSALEEIFLETFTISTSHSSRDVIIEEYKCKIFRLLFVGKLFLRDPIMTVRMFHAHSRQTRSDL